MSPTNRAHFNFNQMGDENKMLKIAIHSLQMANYLLKNNVPMLEMALNKKDNIGLVFYFEATIELKQLMESYSKRK